MKKYVALLAVVGLVLVSGTATASQELTNDLSRCAPGNGPAVLVSVRGIKAPSGNIRVQSYPASPDSWLAKGRWLHRVESRARAGGMDICIPVPSEGIYGIAVRHDLNGNGKTDITQDGGGTFLILVCFRSKNNLPTAHFIRVFICVLWARISNASLKREFQALSKHINPSGRRPCATRRCTQPHLSQ